MPPPSHATGASGWFGGSYQVQQLLLRVHMHAVAVFELAAWQMYIVMFFVYVVCFSGVLSVFLTLCATSLQPS